jgi:hypothetical protein
MEKNLLISCGALHNGYIIFFEMIQTLNNRDLKYHNVFHYQGKISDRLSR